MFGIESLPHTRWGCICGAACLSFCYGANRDHHSAYITTFTSWGSRVHIATAVGVIIDLGGRTNYAPVDKYGKGSLLHRSTADLALLERLPEHLQ